MQLHPFALYNLARLCDNAKMINSSQLQAAVELLESTDQFRILKAINPPQYHPDRAFPVTCVIVDSEATSSDPATARAIELGMIKVGFDPLDPSRFTAIDSFSMLNDPGVPSVPGAQAVHGISDDELAGHKFDQDEISEFLNGVDFVIAHNSAYDRPVLSRDVPALASMPWMCSMKQIPWAELKVSSRALDYLVFRAGFFHLGHRALADCEALFAVLCHRFADGITPLQFLAEAREDQSWIILCEGAPFDAKDAMKDRGYRWNPGDRPGDIPVKCWSTPELDMDSKLLVELTWLFDEIYSKNEKVHLSFLPMNSSIRYSQDDRLVAFTKRQKLSLAGSVEQMKLDGTLPLLTQAPTQTSTPIQTPMERPPAQLYPTRQRG